MISFLKRILGSGKLPAALSYENARAVLEAHQREREEELAARTDAQPEMLYYLAERGTGVARRAVAANPATPAVANCLLAGDSDSAVREELARKIGRLLPDLMTDEQGKACRHTMEALERLAGDQLPRVRAILAEEIKALDCAPASVVLQLAHDVEEIVAAPVLEYSPLLSDADLLEIMASASAQNALAAVARRRNLSEDISDAVVASLDIPAVAALLANPSARIRAEALDRIVENAASIEPWHGPLVLRADLSMRVVRRIAGFVGAAMLAQLSARSGLDEETRAHLNQRLHARIEEDDPDADTAQHKALAEALAAHANGTLDGRFVEEAAQAGNRELVVDSLALLVHAPRMRVAKILSTGGAKAVTALVWRAGLSMRTAFAIQKGILKLPAEELLPARGGIKFPLREDEMCWQLSYFGLENKK